ADDAVAHDVIGAASVAVEPDERQRDDDELGSEVDVVEEGHHRQVDERVLDLRLDVDAQVGLHVQDPVGVGGGDVLAAGRQPAGELVDDVGGEEDQDLALPATAAASRV